MYLGAVVDVYLTEGTLKRRLIREGVKKNFNGHVRKPPDIRPGFTDISEKVGDFNIDFYMRPSRFHTVING